MIKLVTIDLDGTLFDNDKKISKENKEAIKACKKLGVRIVLSTGRPLKGVLPVLEELELLDDTDYCIIYNGAKIFNTKTKELVFSSSINGKDVKDLYAEALKHNTHYHAFCLDETLVTMDNNPYTDYEARINNLEANLFDFTTVKDEDLFLKAMMVDDEKMIDYLIENVDQKFKDKYSMVRSSKIFLEFLNKNTNKGNALIALAKYLNIDIKDTMAIGDQDNDLSMIKAAGIGVAMENAVSYVKDVAKFITKDNLSSGVAYALEELILKK